MMASKSIQACGHRARQALRSRPRFIGRADSDDFLHGELVTNRQEKRAARKIAALYGCDAKESTHSKRCPKFEEKKDSTGSAVGDGTGPGATLVVSPAQRESPAGTSAGEGARADDMPSASPGEAA